MSVSNRFSVFDSDSEGETSPSEQFVKKSVKDKNPKSRFIKPKFRDGDDGKAVGPKSQPKFPTSSKKTSWRSKGPRVSRPRFKPSSRDNVLSQIVDSALASKGEKLSQKQRKRLAREQKKKLDEEKEISSGMV